MMPDLPEPRRWTIFRDVIAGKAGSWRIADGFPVERCPTCGATVEVVTADEGTSHYRPVPEADLEAAEARARTAEEALRRITALSPRTRAAASDNFEEAREIGNAALATIRGEHG